MLMIIISLPCSIQLVPSHGKSPWQSSDAGQEDMASAEHEDATKAASWDNSSKKVPGSLTHIWILLQDLNHVITWVLNYV